MGRRVRWPDWPHGRRLQQKQTTTTTTKLLWTNRLSSHLPTPCRLIQLLDYHHHLPNINFAPSITCKLTRVSLTGPTQYQNSLIITFTIKKKTFFSPLNPDNPGLAC